jgi:hypothetical protein
MYNVDIRDAIKSARVFNYEVAKELNVHETSFSRKISREEFSPQEKTRILEAIKTIVARGGNA